MPTTHRLLQIAIGGGDDPYVHGLGPAAAHGFELTLLEHAEQLDLRLERQVPNLVEEDGPTMGKLEAADPPIDGAGEGALDVSEEFALDEAGRDGAAVDAGDGQGANASPVDHERDDDIGAHAVTVGPLLHREFALCAEVSAKEQVLLAKDATHVAIIGRHLEADREVIRRQGALEREETQYIAPGVVKKNGGPVKGHHTSN